MAGLTVRAPAGRSAVLLPLAAATAAMAAFQVGAAVAKGLFAAVGPEGAAAMRLVIAAAVLLVFTRPWRAWPRPAPLIPLLGLGASMAAAVLFFYMAIDRLPLGVAIAVQFLGPLGVAVAGSRRASDLVWAVLAGAGVWSLVGVRGGVEVDLLGLAFALAAAAGWAGYILFGRRASVAFGHTTAALAVSVSALIVLPVGVQHAGAALLNPALLPLAVLVALLSVVLPFSLELYAMPRVPARTFAVFTSLEPVFGVLSGLVLLGERLSPSQIAGVALVIAAAAGAAWTSAERRPPAKVPEAPPA